MIFPQIMGAMQGAPMMQQLMSQRSAMLPGLAGQTNPMMDQQQQPFRGGILGMLLKNAMARKRQKMMQQPTPIPAPAMPGNPMGGAQSDYRMGGGPEFGAGGGFPMGGY